MSDRTLVSGFLAFGGFEVNPSALLAQSLGRRFKLIEVSFAAVEDFLDRVSSNAAGFERLLMLGVRGDGSSVYLEHIARNVVGDSADVRGIVRPGPIDARGPATLATTLFEHPMSETHPSDDAGSYLCNYLYYGALSRLPRKRVGFVHVAPLDVIPLDRQRRTLQRLLQTIERSAP